MRCHGDRLILSTHNIPPLPFLPMRLSVYMEVSTSAKGVEARAPGCFFTGVRRLRLTLWLNILYLCGLA